MYVDYTFSIGKCLESIFDLFVSTLQLYSSSANSMLVDYDISSRGLKMLRVCDAFLC